MRSFVTKRNELFSHRIRPDKISNMLFLNDLNSFDVQRMIFHYYQSRSLRNSLFNNNVISSLSSITPFLVYAYMMSEGISCRQLTSLSSLRQLRDFVFWHPSRESHQQTHIKSCDVRIRFSFCGSRLPESIRSHHFMNFSWLRYRIQKNYWVIKTSDCVFNHHLLISLSNVFKIEVLWRYNSGLATSHPLNLRNKLSSSSSLSKKVKLRASKRLCFYWFFNNHVYIAGVYWDIIMMASLIIKRIYIDL